MNANPLKTHKIAFFVWHSIIFDHYQPILEMNNEIFEILVPDEIEEELILKIRRNLTNKDIRIRAISELIEHNLIYKKIISNYPTNNITLYPKKNNRKEKIILPTVKLLGQKNIRLN